MDKEKKTKQYEQLSRQIANLLRDFERNRQWADIGNWLSRLLPVLAARKYSNLPHKINLSKRLAQCLNPSLPAGIHSNTLSVYNTIFNNFTCKTQLLPLFSIGLFPFFQYSSSALKLQLIKIFETHYIQTSDCLQMITSMMNALLTGLNETNEELAKRIYAFCDKVSNSYGRMWVDGAVWINILKSPKVRMSGFKYFMKTFKDRDKHKRKESNSEQKISGKEESLAKQDKPKTQQDLKNFKTIETQVVEPTSNMIGSVYDSFLSDHQSNDTNSEIFSQLSKIKNLEDTFKSRFPNFSTLVVNALCQCLQSPLSDTLVRRSALDLMIFYLALDNKELITEKDGIYIVSVLLQTIKIKEYSLTRRIYTYLFGQPNAEGVYCINENQRGYELKLLEIAIEKMLKATTQNEKKAIENQGSLMILQILFKDHEKLAELILPDLAFQILTFLKLSKISGKRVIQFYLNVIQPSNQVFIQDLKSQIISERPLKQSEVAKDIVETIDYFYSLKHEIQNSNKQQIPKEQILTIIEWLLKYLYKTKCQHEKIAIEILELCNKFIKFIPTASQQTINEQSIHLLNELISIRPPNSVYAGLLTLHPHPAKETLLPYMNQISLSIVCISNLLQISPENLNEKEKSEIFFALFKLLNCHLWQDQGINFIKIYKNKYPKQYAELIDKVQPSEWLIYWKKMSGDVDGGVIRMLKNLDDDNHLNKQLSKKWLENSKHICSRVVDPIYKIMKEEPIEKMKDIYKMIQRVFLIQKTDFISFFFLQRQRYFLPLIDKIFDCIYNGDQDLKANSIAMLTFLMERAGDINEKLSFIETTIERTIFLLRKTLGGKGNYQREIEIIEYFISMVDLFESFKHNEKHIQKLKTLVQDSQLYETVAMGMKQTIVPYVRTLYIDFIQKSVEVFAIVTKDVSFISVIMTCILEKLLLMLRQNDVTMLQQIIKGKELSNSGGNRRKKSDMQIDINNLSQSTFNVEAKYAQVIELWNSVKFLVNVSIQNKIKDLPIEKLLSLILQSFPFSEIVYSQISPEMIQLNYQQLQQEIKNMTGLKKQVLQIFQTLWINYETKIINFLIKKGDPRVLIHGCVQPNAVIKAITNSSNCVIIGKYFKGNKFTIPKGMIHYNTQILLMENQICYFLYLYLLYCNLNVKSAKKENSFIESTLNLLKSLKISTHIQTKLWILQTLYCFYERIPFKNLQLQNSRVKSQFQEMTKDLVDQLMYIVAKTKNFTHRIQIKSGIFNIFGKTEQAESSLFDFVKIFPPTLYHMSEKFVEISKTKKNSHIVPSEDLVNHFLFSKWVNLTHDYYIQYLSIVCIKTFSKIFISLLMNVYENDIVKITSMTRDWLLLLFPLYENKSQDNQSYLETVAEFLHVLLMNPNLRPELIKNMRKNIIQIFMGNDFFKCTKNTLNNWKFIIDCCTEGYDLLGSLLATEGLFDFFTRRAQSTRLKIKNFERVCFVIYSGRVDKYENRLKIVLQSLNEVMKSENPSSALLILILFCIRILFMRLSQSSLSRMFRSFWPSLITLLIQIYTKPAFTTCTNLLLAGLKVIELVHALQLQEFNIHQWIFVFDYFGIRIDSQTEAEQLLVGNSKKILTPFKFNPILTKVLPQNPLKCSFLPQVWPDQSNEPGKRKLIVKEASIESDQQLRNHALILLQYMIDLNQRRVNVVREQIEDLIEADFISLDDYIFQVK